LVLTQGVKRCPINLRRLLLIPRSVNPKGIALFLSSFAKLSRIGLIERNDAISSMADKLLSLRSPDRLYSCWGYNFDWQTRGDLVPKGSANIICTTFAANALLDAYELKREPTWLDAAVSAADFILNDLFWRGDGSKACFSYTRLERGAVHNANLLGATLLCRIAQVSGENRFFEPALDATHYSVRRQHADGSWDYGESPQQSWVDNFHTGFNLVALRRIAQYTETAEFDAAIRRGHDFFRTHFFKENGAPKYFHNATYPIDIHSVAQSILTLIEFRSFSEDNISLAHLVLKWGLANMWDGRGFFYFQKNRFYTMRVSFMRWSQAWMLLALSSVLEIESNLGSLENRE